MKYIVNSLFSGNIVKYNTNSKTYFKINGSFSSY